MKRQMNILVLIKYPINDLRYGRRHGCLFQNFYNRQTTYYSFYFGAIMPFFCLDSILMTFNLFLKVSYRNSSTVTHVCNDWIEVPHE